MAGGRTATARRKCPVAAQGDANGRLARGAPAMTGRAPARALACGGAATGAQPVGGAARWSSERRYASSSLAPRRARADHGERATRATLGVGTWGGGRAWESWPWRGSRVGGRGLPRVACGTAVGAEKKPLEGVLDPFCASQFRPSVRL